MNILLINHYAGSKDMGMEFRPYYFAKEWVKMGHNVYIVCGDYSHLRAKNPNIEQDFYLENIEGINYCWFKTGTYEGNGIKRALTMFRFVYKLFHYKKRIIKEFKPDVVIASSTYPLDTYAAQAIAKTSKAKLIHEVHDMWPATLIEIGGMPKWHPFIVLLQIAENSAYKKSDYVVSLPSCAESYMLKHGLKKGRFFNIPNGVSLQDWENPMPLPQQHEEALLPLEEKFVVGYFGGHALSNALDIYLNVAKATKNPNIHFVMAGNGVEKPRLIKRIKEENINNITVLSPVPKMAIPSLVQHFNCSYVGALDSPLYRFGICMNKIFDSMMAGAPIICAINTPDKIILNNQCGIMVEANDITAIINAIETLYNMPKDECQKMGQNGKNAAIEKYNYASLAKEFENLFKN